MATALYASHADRVPALAGCGCQLALERLRDITLLAAADVKTCCACFQTVNILCC